MKHSSYFIFAHHRDLTILKPFSKTLGKIILSLILLFTLQINSNASCSFSNAYDIRKKFKTNSDTSAIYKYSRLALRYAGKPQNLEIMKSKIDTAEMICDKENIELPSILHLARAEYFFLKSDFIHSSQDATIALKLAKTNNETETLANTLQFFGRYSLRTGFFKESIDYFNNSIVTAKKEKINGIVPRSYYGISDVYLALGDIKKYYDSLQELIEAGEIEKDTFFIKTGYFKWGSTLTNQDRNFRKADSLLKKCLELALITNDTSFSALSLANIGWNHYLEKDYKTAIEFYSRSLKYSLPSKRHSYAANSYGNLGTIYRDLGDNELSLKFYKKSIDQAKIIEDIYNLSWVYEDMSQMYLRKKDTANAYLNYVMFKKYSDANIKSSNTAGLSDARIRYEADSQNKEFELLSLRIRNQRLLIYGYTGLVILGLAISILIISRSKINARRRISEMNHKISEVTQANLRQQMNPHFIFNTLNSIQYYMYQHDKLATNNYLTKFSSLMRKVLENSQHTSVPLCDELDALTLYLELEKIRFKEKFDYQINIDEEIDCILYKVPTMLIQPYVENSICHGLMPGEEKGLVRIDIQLKKDYISCTIEDNGIGREAAQEKKMNGERNHNSLGTQIVASRLDLVNSLYGTSLKTIYSDLKNEAGEPTGTRVEIQIPLLS
jgi:tetratricopeptide (TPR) repeat protein